MCDENPAVETTNTDSEYTEAEYTTPVTVNGTTYNVGDKIRMTRRVYNINTGSVVEIIACDINDPGMPVAINDLDGDHLWLRASQFEPAPVGAELSTGEPESYNGLKIGDIVTLMVSKHGTPAGTKCRIGDLDLDHESEHILVNLDANGDDQAWLEDDEYTTETATPTSEPAVVKQAGITLGALVVPDASLTLAPLAEIMTNDPISPTLDGAQSVYLDGENTNVLVLAGISVPLIKDDPTSPPITAHSVYAVKDSMIMRFNMIDGGDTAVSFGAERYAIAFAPMGRIVASTVANTIEEALRWIVDMKLTSNQKLMITISGGFAG